MNSNSASLARAKDHLETVQELLSKDEEFAECLLHEAMSSFLNGEPDVSRLMLRNVVNGTIGFEALAEKVGRPSKSLHRMLSAKGNPTMDNLAAIIGALRSHLSIEVLQVTSGTAETYEEDEFQQSEEDVTEEQLQTA